MKTKAHSLAHTKWLCKYHIVFTQKYRRKIIFAQLRESIKEILQCFCKYKGVEILEGHLMPDHVHMLVSIPPKISVANFMGYLKGYSINTQTLSISSATENFGPKDIMSVRWGLMRQRLKSISRIRNATIL